MKLWCQRHCDAGMYSTDPVKERARPLSAEGRKVAAAIAAQMKKLGEKPRIIFASNYARTTETADIVGKILDVPVNQVGELSPHFPICAFYDELLENDVDGRIMFVAHVDNLDPFYERITGEDDADPWVKGEVRRLKVDRSDGGASMKWQLLPSDVGFDDDYEP